MKLSSFIERTCGEAATLLPFLTCRMRVMDQTSQSKMSSHGPTRNENGHFQQRPNPESSERFLTPSHSPKASLDRPVDRQSRRSDIFRPGDLAYNNMDDLRPHGALPSLNLQHDEEYRARQ